MLLMSLVIHIVKRVIARCTIPSSHHSQHRVPMCLTLTLTGVLAGNCLTRRRARGKDLTRLADVKDRSTGRGIRAARRQGSIGVSELDLIEVSEGNQGETLLEILDNPFGVGLAQIALSRSEGVSHALAGGRVLDYGWFAGSLGIWLKQRTGVGLW